MRLQKLKINSSFKNLENFEIDFSNKDGIAVLIGNNGIGKSNVLEAISSIFAGLYNNSYNPIFNYKLTYTKDTYTVDVKFENSIYEYKINDVIDNLRPEHLPSQVISSYSGEESRLWNTYYKPFYDEYTNALRGATLPNSKLIYINKYYWNIALLTLHFYDFDTFSDIRNFCQEKLNITTFNSVTFDFDISKLETWLRSPNPVTNFILQLNPNKEASITLTLDEFRQRLSHLSEREVFHYLSASFMPKDHKTITKISVDFNNNLKSDVLSEGEKKMLLIMLILEVVGDENSLILLDEPDSHIHLSRKYEIQKLLSKYSNRDNIITTHSPTLTHCFDLKHITMLGKNENNCTQVENIAKQEVVHKLTDGIWSYQQQNIFLNSDKDILLVEGKSDETYLSKALQVLKGLNPDKYSNLQFEYLPCGGANGVQLLTEKFQPKNGQKIIALFDSDKAGWESINRIIKDSNNRFNKSNFGPYRKEGAIYIAIFPTRPAYRGGENFNIEDYFSKKLLNKYVFKEFKGLDSIVTKNAVKRALEKACINGDIPDEEFKHFHKVFDLILEIKQVNYA